MPAYSFQERFIPSIQDGSKAQTIRAFRKGRSGHARPGDKLYLYYGMRTKWCRKIGEAICRAVHPIRITNTEILVAGYYDTETETGTREDLLFFPHSEDEREIFAWKDGFRPEGSTIEQPAGALDLMLRFWRQTHELPFEGVVIYWKDFVPSTS